MPIQILSNPERGTEWRGNRERTLPLLYQLGFSGDGLKCRIAMIPARVNHQAFHFTGVLARLLWYNFSLSTTTT
jgi:hypothetical protein